jgi:hypothetical protein
VNQPDPLDPYDFDVTQNEAIQFVVTTIGTAEHIHLVLDGEPLVSPYKFTVTKPKPHIQVVTSEFDFDPGAPATAYYDIRVTGSLGGDFKVPRITPDSGIKDPGFSFGVVAP